MNESIEKVLAILDGFRMSDEMTYSAYSALYDEISLLDDLLKEQQSAYERGKRDGVSQYLREREEDEEYEY